MTMTYTGALGDVPAGSGPAGKETTPVLTGDDKKKGAGAAARGEGRAAPHGEGRAVTKGADGPAVAGSLGQWTEEAGEVSPARLRTAVSRMARWLRPTAAAGALTATEIDMLMVAERRGPARMSDFAAFCGLNPTMLSRMVPRLEEAGLLSRQTDPDDKRAALIEATPAGHELLARVRSERNDVLSAFLDELESGERRAIADATPVLEKLAERLRDQATTEGHRR